MRRYRDAPSLARVAIATRLHTRRLARAAERLVVPATTRQETRRIDDFRRVIVLIAVAAVGFFVPSLPMAGVPIAQWLPFGLAAGLAAIVVAGSFFVVDRGARVAAVLAFADACVIGFIGWLFGPYYHQIGLLFALLVGGFAVVHGLRASLGAVLPGAFLVPYVIHAPAGVNATDPVYAFIYLMGAALVPWTAGRLAGRRARALRRQVGTIQEAEREAVLILARAAEAKDEDTGEHVARVGELSAALAERLGLPAAEVEDIRYAAMLHDVGKLHVPDSILLKSGPLLPAEWDVMRSHTVWGAKIMGSSAAFDSARAVARWHHEDWDGAGYPDGLRHEAIPLVARIVRLADVFDALRTDRPYKPAWELERCLEEIQRNAGRQFDPDLVQAFISIVERQPPASPIVAVRSVVPDPQLMGKKQAATKPRSALTVGAVIGGQHDRPAVETALRSAARAVAAVSLELSDADKEASVNVIFQVSGHLFRTDHEGIRTGRFTKAKGLLVVEVGVPDYLSDPIAAKRYYGDSLVEAVALAESYLAGRAPQLSVARAKEASQAARALMLTAGHQLPAESSRAH